MSSLMASKSPFNVSRSFFTVFIHKFSSALNWSQERFDEDFREDFRGRRGVRVLGLSSVSTNGSATRVSYVKLLWSITYKNDLQALDLWIFDICRLSAP